jgi:integrase
MRTSFPGENEDSLDGTKDSPNIPAELGNETEQDVKFPKRLRYRGKGRVLGTIYKRPEGYRLYWRARVDGKPRSRFKDFPTYSAAKREGDKVVEDIHKGAQAARLSPGQTTDALAALECLQRFYERTGRRFSTLRAVSEFCGASSRLGERPLGEAVDAFLNSIAVVKRVDVAQAVEEFIGAEGPRTKAREGKRPDLSPKYHYNRAIMLRRLASAFPNTVLCDLAKAHLDMFFASLGEMKSRSRNRKPVTSGKARNHHRAAVRQFLQWAVRKDYLPANHRLLEADGMRPENGNTAEIEFYTPAELKALLDAAEGPMRAMVAIGGLAGLRTSELLRLTWEDTRRVEGHIEVSAGKAKTRQRRLVEIVPTLAQWLAEFQGQTGRIWTGHEITFQQHFCALCEKATVQVRGKEVPVARKPNGLRHSFCTYHLAAYGNENATALQAGNSPQMLFGHYRGLARKAEGEAWFAAAPEQPANVITLAAREPAQPPTR